MQRVRAAGKQAAVRSWAVQGVREVSEGSAPSTDHVQQRGSRLELVRVAHRASTVDDNHGGMMPADMETDKAHAHAAGNGRHACP